MSYYATQSPKVDRKDAAAEEATLSIQRNIDTIFAALAKKDEEIKELQDELPCDDNASGELKKDTEDLKYEMEVAKEKIQELEVKVADMEEKLEAVMVEDKTYTF